MLLFTLCISSYSHLQAESGVNESNLYLAKIRSNHDNAWTGNLNILAGFSEFIPNEWDGVVTQSQTGFSFDIGKKSWLAHLAIDYRIGTGSDTYQGVDHTSDLTELDLGMRMYYEADTMKWASYFGLGLALIEDKLEAPGIGLSEEGSELGYWFNAGLIYRFHNKWNLGVDFRYTDLFVDTVDNPDIIPNHFFYGLTAGYHW